MLCLELCRGHRSRKEFVCGAIYTLPTPSSKPQEIVNLWTRAAQGAAAECGTLTKLVALQIRHTSFSPQRYPIISTANQPPKLERSCYLPAVLLDLQLFSAITCPCIFILGREFWGKWRPLLGHLQYRSPYKGTTHLLLSTSGALDARKLILIDQWTGFHPTQELVTCKSNI